MHQFGMSQLHHNTPNHCAKTAQTHLNQQHTSKLKIVDLDGL